MTGIPLILFFVAAIAVMVLSMARWKVHPFIAIMLTSLVLGLVAGLPLVDSTVDGVKTPGIVTVIGQGFSSIFTSIGIVIILGALIGAILEETGAALKLADMVIRLVGRKHPVLAMSIMGWVVAIPVFCDSGFVVLNPIRKALVKRTGVSSVAMTVALSAGLYIAHVFIPPTPGPLASASALGLGNEIPLVMGIGVLCSIAPLAAGVLFANFIGKRVKADDEAGSDSAAESYEQLVASYGKLPGGLSSVAPILVPILLMAASSVISVLGLKGGAADALAFISTPVMALTVGAALAVLQLRACCLRSVSKCEKGRGSGGVRAEAVGGESGGVRSLGAIMEQTLKTVGPILFITAAGGVLGKIVASSDLVSFIKDNAQILSSMGVFFPFLLAAILKSSMGSSTVAIITTAGIVSPLLPVLGFTTPVGAALACMAISAGSMTVSHANDSYFWVVTNFGGMSMERGYRTQTLLTLIMGLAAIAEIFVLSLILG